MAEQTPKKTLTSYICRCCNCSFQNNPIDLFGTKYESEHFIALLGNVTGLDFEKYAKVPTVVSNSLRNLRSCALSLLQIRPIQSGLKEEKIVESPTRLRNANKSVVSTVIMNSQE